MSSPEIERVDIAEPQEDHADPVDPIDPEETLSRFDRWNRPLPEAWASMLDHRIGRRDAVIDMSGLGIVLAAVTAWWFEPWHNSLRVPILYYWDGLFFSMNAKSIIESGWVQGSDRLGAPFGQSMYDYPIGGDNGNYAIMRILSLGTGDFAMLYNAFYVLTFFLIAFAAYLCSRKLGTGRVAAVTIGFVYCLAPYHFLRAGHLVLANYAVIPLAVVVAVRAASGRGVRSSTSATATLACVAACLALGSFNAYYGVFALLAIAFMAAVSAATNRTIRPLRAGATLGGLTAAVMVANQLGSILVQVRDGTNTEVGNRVPIETDLYAFRLIQALTPVPGTRVPLIGRATDLLLEGYESEQTMFFGVVGALCLLGLLGWTALAAVSRRRDGLRPLPALLGIAALFFIIVGGTGGLNWLFLLADFERIRGWGRVSVVVVFLALVWAGLMARPLVDRIKSRGSAAVVVGVAMVIGAVAVVDQVTPDVTPTTDEWKAAYDEDREFFDGVENELPTGAAVAQLPIVQFPGPGVVDSGPYDLLRPFLSTSDLRWSYGGMRGRISDWQLALRDAPTDAIVDAFVAFGFEAIVVDREGYDDRAAQLGDDLGRLTGADPRISRNGKWLYVPLPRSASALGDDELAELRERLLAPVRDL